MAYEYEVTISESTGERKLRKVYSEPQSRNAIVREFRDNARACGLSIDDYPIIVGIRGRSVQAA